MLAAVVIPGAAFVLTEMGLCAYAGSGADWAYVQRLVGQIGLCELGVLVAVGAILALLTPRAIVVPVSMGLAMFVGLILSTLMMLGNGLPPLFRLGAHWRAALLSVALIVALMAGLSRAVVAMRRSSASPMRLLDIVAGPTLLPPAVLVTWELAWHLGIRGASPMGLALLLGAGTIAMLTGRWLGRRPSGWTIASCFGTVPVLAFAGALTLGTVGRSPFPEIPSSPPARRPDVLLIALDTVRPDAAPAPPDAPVPTPMLARLPATRRAVREGRLAHRRLLLQSLHRTGLRL